MNKYLLDDMIGGWFIGDFEPSILKTDLFEVGFKKYNMNDEEDLHVHNIVREYTLVTFGVAEVNGEIIRDGEVFVVEPGEPTKFIAKTNCNTVVVKVPSIPSDKTVIEKD